MQCIYQTIPDTSGSYAKVWGKNIHGEYVVKYYNSRHVHMDASDYFTDDRDDAIATVLAEINRSEYQTEAFMKVMSHWEGLGLNK